MLVIVSFVCSVLIFSAFATESCEDADGLLYSGLLYSYDVKCVPGAGGIIAIFNIVLILAALVISWLACAPGKPVFLVRVYEEGDDKNVQPVVPGNAGEKDEDSTYVDPTQTMDNEMNRETAAAPEAPTLNYIRAETTDNRN
jgi:hypothetical protein